MEKRTAKRMYQHKEGHNITVKVDIETYYRMKGIVEYDLEQGKSQSLTAIVNDLLKRYAVRRRKDAEKGLELLEEEIADTPEPKDENNMKPLECFVYGVKTARKNEVEVLKDWIKNAR